MIQISLPIDMIVNGSSISDGKHMKHSALAPQHEVKK